MFVILEGQGRYRFRDATYEVRSVYYGDIAEMAAALFESLLINHAFVDGNKRAAFFMTDAFCA